jgi:rod shape-determining protein MreC
MGLLVLGWVIFLGQPTAVSIKLRMICVQLITPFVKLGDVIPVVRSRRELARENQELRAANETLRREERAFAEMGREDLDLRKLLNVKPLPTTRTIGARVIGHDASNWWKSIQIDRGAQDGLRENMPVVNADGLIGKTIYVTAGEARVLLLTDPNCKVSALLQDSREPGIVSGSDNALAGSPLCQMTFVDRKAVTREGESVVTSGLGSVFPKGILIGAVKRAQINPQTGMYQDIEVVPAVDFYRLEAVEVILE